MSEHTYAAALDEPEQAHRQIVALWPELKQELASGRHLWVEVQPLEEARDLQRNKEYWGYVLRPISEQAQIGGMGATSDGWHDYYRLMFLGYEFTKVRLPGKKRPSVRKALKSTTALSNRAMREYMEQIRAHAATTFAVTFPVPPWVEEEMRRNAIAPPRITRTPKTTIDAETGEILETA
jgi:hypothetical protein